MIFIWKNIYCGLHVQMGIDLHRKTSGTPENTIRDLIKIKENYLFFSKIYWEKSA